MGENLFKLLSEPEGEQLRQRLQPLCFVQPVVSSSQVMTTANGETRYYQWSDRALFSKQGEILEFQSVGQDITAIKKVQEEKFRKKRTEELLQANSHLSVIAPNLPGAVFRCICHRDPQFDLVEHHTLTIPYVSVGVKPLTG